MKQVPAPAILPFRFFPIAAALLLSSVLSPGRAGAEWGLEITPYAGYAIGGNFTDNSTGTDLDVKEGGNFGLVLGLPDTPETQYELFYGFQRTEVSGGGTFGGEPLFDLDIHYLQLGGPTCSPRRRSVPSFPGGLARRTSCRTGAG